MNKAYKICSNRDPWRLRGGSPEESLTIKCPMEAKE